jgi:hypothetical protein
MTPPTFKPDDIELIPDAWGRFERAVDVAVKSGPQHRSAKDRVNGPSPQARRFDLVIDESDSAVHVVYLQWT